MLFNGGILFKWLNWPNIVLLSNSSPSSIYSWSVSQIWEGDFLLFGAIWTAWALGKVSYFWGFFKNIFILEFLYLLTKITISALQNSFFVFKIGSDSGYWMWVRKEE